MQKHPSIELLESRIAPAVILNPTTVTYSDVDGDDVTIHISKPLFTTENLNQVLFFSDSTARLDGSLPQALSTFLVKNFGDAASGVDISITAKRSAIHGGNGVVDVGGIDAFTSGDFDNIDLGKVRVQGDLKFIDAGDANFATPALKSLDVLSIGEAIPDVKSEINGSIGTWKVRGNMYGELVQSDSKDLVHAGKILIGGSLGRADADTSGSGSLLLSGSAGSIKIGHDLVGGAAVQTGAINVNGSIGALKIGGSVRAGQGALTGFINALGEVGSLHIGGDLIGGSAQASGLILVTVGGNVGSIQISGSILGGTGHNSGAVFVDHAKSITVGHDLIGQSPDGSGSIFASTVDKVRIGGSMIGADTTGITGQIIGTGSGSIFATNTLGSVSVGGDVVRANIVAGIASNEDLEFGPASGNGADFDLNPEVVSRIAKITIKGTVNTGTSGHYGIEANSIGKVRIGGVSYVHTDPTINFAQGFTVDGARRFTVREL
jgi:hypothetical protein